MKLTARRRAMLEALMAQPEWCRTDALLGVVDSHPRRVLRDLLRHQLVQREADSLGDFWRISDDGLRALADEDEGKAAK